MSTFPHTVAVLYVLERSSGYRDLPDVDLWPKSRDARLYAGPHPVIAHPPCGPWSAHWAHAAKRDPKELAPLAVHQVRRWGGILEHPAHSRLWKEMDLPPARPLDKPGLFDHPLDYSIEVEQGWWGHLSRKPTWLYVVGIPRGAIVLPPPVIPPPGPERPLRHDPRRARPYQLSTWDCLSPSARKRTPPDFAAWLVALARQAKPPPLANLVTRQPSRWEPCPCGGPRTFRECCAP